MVTDPLPEPGHLKTLPMDNLNFEKNTIYRLQRCGARGSERSTNLPKVTEQVTELGLPAPVGTRTTGRGCPAGPGEGPPEEGLLSAPPARRQAQGRKSGRGAGTRAHSKEAAGTRGAFPSARGLGHAGRAAHGGGVRTAGPEATAGARGLAG